MELLISAVNADCEKLLTEMKLHSDAVLVNQCDYDSEEIKSIDVFKVKVLCRNERGVGKSRNLAFACAQDDLILFSDEDIVYESNYDQLVEKEFLLHPEADLILFNVDVCPERKTYENTQWKSIKWYNCGRYPAYSIAARREKLFHSGVKYSELFGGGAKYSNGEDSLFLKQCCDSGLNIFTSPVKIGKEIPRESTWFHGFTEKFFFDRGVLFAFLYGKMARIWALRFVLTKKEMFQGEIGRKQAYKLLQDGIAQGKLERKMPEEKQA